jgi:hypothetical protein
VTARPSLTLAEEHVLCPGAYHFTVLQDGSARWRMQVTRRQAAI